MRPEETKWGDHLVTFEHDHLEMAGFSADHYPANVYNLVVDNIRLNEVLRNEEEAQRFGVDHLSKGPYESPSL